MSRLSLKDLYVAAIKGNPYHAKDGKFTTASGVGQADEIPSPPKRQDIPATILSRQYIHGTSKSDGMKILESGEIRPRDADPKKRGGMMDPVKNRIYLSSSPDYNAIYALGGDVAGTNYFEDEYGKKDIERNGRYGYLFEVDNSALVDIQPDEDQVGEATYKAFRGDDFRGQPVIPVILHLAQKHLTPNQIRKVKYGDYASWAAAGKKIVKHMTDGQKIRFIELYNSHVAHDGALPIKRAWRVDRTRGKEIKRDGSNLFEIAEEIPVKDSLRKSVSRAIKAFDPNQPRDERGRWSSSGRKFNEAAERTMLEVLGEASNWQTASWIGESGKYIGEGVDHEESAQRVVDKLGLPEKGLGGARQLVALGAIRLSGSDNDWAISIGVPPTDKQWAALRSVIEGANYLTWDLSGAGQERVWSTSRASADERESDLRDSVGAYFRQNDVAGVVSDPVLAAEWMANGIEARFGWNEKNTRAGYLARKKKELRANPASKEFTSRVDEATKKLRASGVVGKDVVVVALGKGESGYESGRYDDTTKTIYLYEDSKPGSRETLGEPISSVSSAFENPIEGTLAHEYGHHVASVIDPGSLDRANFILAESSREVRGHIKRLISYYASTHPVEFVAETYALRNHPKYDDLGDDTKFLVGRILGETMTKAGFDPSEPRDERGRWTTGGVQTSWEGEFEKFAGGDATAVNSARHFVETQVGGEDKYDIVGAEQKKSRFEIKYVGKLGPGISKGKREESFGDESTGIFTSSFDVYTNDALGKDFSDTVPESFLALAGPNTFFRGMDDKGLLDAMKRGQIESLGGLNIGDSQVGRTYFSLSPQTAINYTTSLTGPKWRPTFERSCYVVAVRGVPGQNGWERDENVDEWGKRGPTSVDDIVGVLEIRVRSQEPGSIDLNDRGRMSSAWPPHTKYAYRDATREFTSRESTDIARPDNTGNGLTETGTPPEMRSNDDEWRRATEKTARLLVDNALDVLRPGDAPQSMVAHARVGGNASILLAEMPVRERVKQKGAEWLATRIVGEAPSAKNGGTDIENKISDLFRSWAETTNKSPEAFAIQQAAELEFGSRLSSWQKDIQSGNAISSGLLGSVSVDDARKILRAMYNETQLGLRFAGYKPGDKLTLFRGMAVASDVVDAPGAVIGYQGNALESWTTDLHTARTFSVTQADDATWNMVVLAMDVPVEHVLSLASSGLGCLPEQEVVIMGGLGEGRARVAFSQPGIRWAVLEDLPPGPDEEEVKKGETMSVIINNQPDWMKQLPHSGSEKRIAQRARKASLKKFNPNHDERGRFASQPGTKPLGTDAIDGVFSGGIAAIKNPLVGSPYGSQRGQYSFTMPSQDEANTLGEEIYASAAKTVGSVVGLDDLETHWRGIDFHVTGTIGSGTLGQVVHDEYFDSKKNKQVTWPSALAMNSKIKSPGEGKTVFAHEMGHIIDALLRESPKAGWPNFSESDEADDLMRAINESKSVKELLAKVYLVGPKTDNPNTGDGFEVWAVDCEDYSYGDKIELPDGTKIGLPKHARLGDGEFKSNYVNYTLSKRELFARAFAQWVANRSGDKEMLAYIAKFANMPFSEDYRRAFGGDFRGVFEIRRGTKKNETTTHFLVSTPQWTPDEFVPIEQEIDKIFRAKGMIG